MSAPPGFDRGHTDDLMSFLAASPSPYHAVANTAERLEKAGFRQVEETDAWDGAHRAGKYVLRGGAIVAWYVPEGAAPHTPFRIVGAHTDSPNLRVKPLPDTGAHGWRQVAVEIYGGPLLNSWLDRDLAWPAGSPCGTAPPPGERRPAAAARAPARRPPRPVGEHRRAQARQAAPHAADLGPRRRPRGRPDRASSTRRPGSRRARSPAGT